MGSLKKKSELHHPCGGGRRRKRKMHTASRKSCMIEVSTQPITRKIDAMSKRKYTIRREAGLHLTDRQREMLGIKNCNRLVRRWYPKGTDFNQLSRHQIQRLEYWINSIHRQSLNGETAHAYDSRLAQAA